MRLPLGLMALVGWTLAAQTPPAIENDQVRVLVVTDQPHQKSALHEHERNRVMIYLDAGVERITHEDGRVEDLKFPANKVRWSPAGGKHTSENIGEKPFRIVEVELKKAGNPFRPAALDPVKLRPKLYRVVLDNPQARVLQVRIPAHEKVPLHEHALNRVVVYLTDQHIRVTDEAGKVTESSAKAGEVRWAPTTRHSEENVGDQAFEVAVVELK